MLAQRALFMASIVFGAAVLAGAPVLAQAPEIKITVKATCEKGDSQFEIVNVGDPWPEMMVVSLIRMDTKAVITEREMRMRTGQRVVYRAKDAPDGIEVGMKIESKSYKRMPGYDSIIACSDPPATESVQPPAPAATPTPAIAPPPAPK